MIHPLTAIITRYIGRTYNTLGPAGLEKATKYITQAYEEQCAYFAPNGQTTDVPIEEGSVQMADTYFLLGL